MQTRFFRSARRATLVLAAGAALSCAAGSAHAAAPKVDLHVETGKALVTGKTFQTGSASFATDKRAPACNGSGQRKTIRGATALGTLVGASQTNRPLRPLGISDQFDFGLLVCGVGRALGSDAAFWLYKVNHKSPEVGGDQLKVRNGDDVLWYFSDPAKGINTGDELAVIAPKRVKAGRRFSVRVVAYSATGKREPAAGATVKLGSRKATTDARGRVGVTLRGNGVSTLRATRGADVASQTARVCSAKSKGFCKGGPGKRLYGNASANRLKGTPGPDQIYAGPGRDYVDARGGGRDIVRCGAGRDRAIVDTKDRTRDCEVVTHAGSVM